MGHIATFLAGVAVGILLTLGLAALVARASGDIADYDEEQL